MNENKALQVLEIDNLSNYDSKKLKNQYRKLALKRHPDKGGAHEDFVELSQAYTLLENKLENENKDNDLFKLFTKIISLGKNSLENKKIKDELINIINNLSTKLLDNIERDNLIFLMQMLDMYKNIILDTEVYNEIKKCIDEKLKNVEIHEINPSINDLFMDNVFSLNINNNNLLIPMWHNELTYELNGKTVIVQINPNLPDNCFIDNYNNIHFYFNVKLNNDLLNKKTLDILINNKTYNIKIEDLKIIKEQTIPFIHEGISKINNKDIFDNNNKGFLNINISLI
tara:strand:- start:377 stop:1231 length:855 start_codon:yes stop_codon:yes gene_type:complete